MTSAQKSERLLMARNDSTDADNIAQLMATYQSAQGRSEIEPMIILEPRVVDFSLETLKPDDLERLDSLLKDHFSHVGKPIKIRLNGLLKKRDIDNVEKINDADRALLHMAVKSSCGSEDDSKVHASLMAWDLAGCLSKMERPSGRHAKFTILVDNDGLPETSPVNLKCHAQEQLFNRSPEEIEEYYAAMKSSEPREKIRRWYEKCIIANKKRYGMDFSVDSLDVEWLKNKIRAAKDVKYIEGASANLLRRLVDDQSVAGKMECLVQTGTLSLDSNIFNNQFNIALDPRSAEYVLRRVNKFHSFTAVPSHTSQAATFSVHTLKRHLSGLARWILCYSLGNDPATVSEGQLTLQKEYENMTVKLPDFAMFLLGTGFLDSERARVELHNTEEGSLLFEISNKGIPILVPVTGSQYKVDLGQFF